MCLLISAYNVCHLMPISSFDISKKKINKKIKSKKPNKNPGVDEMVLK